MDFFSIASGSSGNAVCIVTREGPYLVDAGISAKRIAEGLAANAVAPESIKGVFVTHEHLDHISGLSVFCKKYGCPIYATGQTLAVIRDKTTERNRLPEAYYRPIIAGERLRLGSLLVQNFSIPHDGVDPVGYCFYEDGKKLCVATDMGYVDEYILSYLKDSELLYIESNFDQKMLEVGPYPYALKVRVMGPEGHLSNENCSDAVRKLLHEGLRYIVLAHLSKENNFPELALANMTGAVGEAWHFTGQAPEILVALRSEPIRRLTI